MSNPISEFIKKDIQEWDLFSKNFFKNKDYKILKWGNKSRTYKDQNYHYKFQKKTGLQKNKLLNYEYEIIKSNKSLSNELMPKLFNYNDWEVLKLKTIEGIDLENFINSSKKNKFKIIFRIIISIIFKIFDISLSGISYRQLRLRHIFLNDKNKIFFIDFGNSMITKKTNALIFNFKPMHYDGRYKFNRYISISIQLFKSIYIKKKARDYRLRFKMNFEESLDNQLKKLKLQKNKIKEIINFKDNYLKFYDQYPKAVIDSFEFNILNFGFKGNRKIQLIMEILRSVYDLKKSIIFDFNSNCGVSSIYYSLYGAIKIYNYENDNNLFEIKKKLISIYEIDNIDINTYIKIHEHIELSKDRKKIFSYLSLDDLYHNPELINLLEYFDILFIYFKSNKKLIELIGKNFKKIKILDSFFGEFKIIYASK